MLVRLHARLRLIRRKLSRSEWFVRRAGLSTTPDESHEPGILLIQIDGLARTELERALSHHRLPGLRHLLRKRGYRLHDFYPGLPSSTPAVQGELHYGIPAAVPSFSFLDTRVDAIEMMMQPGAAKRIEADLAAQAEGLLKGGSSWSNIYTGGATQEESHFCGASLGLGDLWRTGKLRNLALFAFLHVGSFLRLVALLPVEIVLAVSDAIRGAIANRQPWLRELAFVVARVLVCVGLRELVTLGAKVDVARGLPIVHVNFLGYDEQSHRRGPSSAFAHWTLKGIDRAITTLHRAARRSGRRDYEVWIFSDHGQVRATPFGKVCPGGLDALMRKHLPNPEVTADNAPSRAQPHASAATLFAGPRSARRIARANERAKLSVFEKQVFALAAMGPVGHLYLATPLPADHLRRLAANLVADGLPGVVIPGENGAATWLTSRAEYHLPHDQDMLPHPEALRPLVARDLAALAHHPHGGNLVLLGWNPHGDSFTFAEENGSHAGCSPQETGAFLLLPDHVRPSVQDRAMRPRELRALALRHLKRTPADAAIRRDPTGQSAPLRVATLNVHSCIGMDGRCSPARIARLIDRLDADIIALQELDVGRIRSRREDQLEQLAQFTGMHAAWCPCTSFEKHTAYGHGLLSRFPIRSSRCIALPGPRRAEPRKVLHVCIDILGTSTQVLSTHLGLSRWERLAQVETLLGPDGLGRLSPDDPVIVLGDLNTGGGSPAYRRLAQRLHNVQANCAGHVGQATFPSVLPVLQLDHIFVSPHFGIDRVFVPRNELSQTATDHLPLVAELRLNTPEDAAAEAGHSAISIAVAQGE